MMSVQQAAAVRTDVLHHILTHCGTLRSGERLLILCDDGSRRLAEAMADQARDVAAHVAVMDVKGLDRHGAEPQPEVAAEMLRSDLTVSMCRYSLAHSRARLEASRVGRFLSLPQYDDALLADPAIGIDYRAQSGVTRLFANAFTAGSRVRVKAGRETDVSIRIAERTGNYCPGFVEKAGELGSPPDIEANVSPIEDGSHGTIAVDGSITCPELGLLMSPVLLTVEAGKIVSIASARGDYVEVLERMMGPLGSRRRVLAECGVGLNPKAQLTGNMLTDEGAMGCVHFGFGANHTVGGRNEVDFHLDFVVRDASLWIDDIQYINAGRICRTN